MKLNAADVPRLEAKKLVKAVVGELKRTKDGRRRRKTTTSNCLSVSNRQRHL